jgi:hypothetical protein
MIDVANCVADSWFRLGFESAADMAAAAWLAPSEPYQFADDAVKRLARTTALFLTYDASIAVTPPTSTYALPAPRAFTESAWLNYGGGSNPIQQLRPTSTADLWALDAGWVNAGGSPARISFDAAGPSNAVLYPAPGAGAATLWQIMGLVPPTIASGASTLQVPAVVADYITCAIIAGARSKESDSAMPEVAAHLGERMRLYEAVFQSYWGTGR